MSYHYDWLMRQIEIIAAMLAYILANKKNSIRSVEEAQAVPSGENELYLLLSALVRQGNLCQAEDLLFEALEEPGQMVLDAALRFYQDLKVCSMCAIFSAFPHKTIRPAITAGRYFMR